MANFIDFPQDVLARVFTNLVEKDGVALCLTNSKLCEQFSPRFRSFSVNRVLRSSTLTFIFSRLIFLEKVSISKLSDGILDSIRRYLPNITTLRAGRSPRVTDMALLEFLMVTPSLTTLEIRKAYHLTEEGLLRCIPHMKNLTGLLLEHRAPRQHGVSSADIVASFVLHCPNLTALSLPHLRLSSDALHGLTQFALPLTVCEFEYAPSVTWHSLAEILPKLPKLHTLKMPSISNELTALPQLAAWSANLRVVEFAGSVTEDGMVALAMACPSLERSNGFKAVRSDEGLQKVLTSCRRLRQLYIYAESISPATMILAGINAQSIEEIFIGTCLKATVAVQPFHLCDLIERCTNLSSLYLEPNTKVLDETVLRAVAGHCLSLRRLRVRVNSDDEVFQEAFCDIARKCTLLEVVDVPLSNQMLTLLLSQAPRLSYLKDGYPYGVTDVGVQSYTGPAHANMLQELVLITAADIPFSEVSLVYLLQFFPFLRSLTVRNLYVSDALLLAISKSSTRLRGLDIEHTDCHVTDTGIEALSLNNTKLERLSLTIPCNVSAKAIKDLKTRCIRLTQMTLLAPVTESDEQQLLKDLTGVVVCEAPPVLRKKRWCQLL